MKGLPALRLIEHVLILDDTRIETLHLPALTRIGNAEYAGSLSVDDSNTTLRTIELPAIQTLGSLRANQSLSLESISAPNLHTVSGRLELGANMALTSLSLASLARVGELAIRANLVLPGCMVQALVEQIESREGIDGEVSVHSNSPDCPPFLD